MWQHHSQGWSPRLKTKKWWASEFASFWSWQIQNEKAPCASATMPHWPQTESLYQLWGGINPSNCCLSDTCHSSKESDYTCSKAEWTAPWSLGPQNQSPFLLESTTWVWVVFSTSWIIEILETRAWGRGILMLLILQSGGLGWQEYNSRIQVSTLHSCPHLKTGTAPRCQGGFSITSQNYGNFS